MQKLSYLKFSPDLLKMKNQQKMIIKLQSWSDIYMVARVVNLNRCWIASTRVIHSYRRINDMNDWCQTHPPKDSRSTKDFLESFFHWFHFHRLTGSDHNIYVTAAIWKTILSLYARHERGSPKTFQRYICVATYISHLSCPDPLWLWQIQLQSAINPRKPFYTQPLLKSGASNGNRGRIGIEIFTCFSSEREWTEKNERKPHKPRRGHISEVNIRMTAGKNIATNDIKACRKWR